MQVWNVDLSGADGLLATALVLAPDAAAAVDAAVADPNWEDPSSLTILAVDERLDSQEILELDMPDSEVRLAATPPAIGPTLWKVNWNDGLFHRSAGASLVAAPDAISALRLVLDADPFEGQPPYGVPASYGPVEQFTPADPLIVRIDLDWTDDTL